MELPGEMLEIKSKGLSMKLSLERVWKEYLMGQQDLSRPLKKLMPSKKEEKPEKNLSSLFAISF